MTSYTILEATLGTAVDPELLERALTHRSYAYEHGGLPTNERLEFLGDAVLGVVELGAECRLEQGVGRGGAAGHRRATA